MSYSLSFCFLSHVEGPTYHSAGFCHSFQTLLHNAHAASRPFMMVNKVCPFSSLWFLLDRIFSLLLLCFFHMWVTTQHCLPFCSPFSYIFLFLASDLCSYIIHSPGPGTLQWISGEWWAGPITLQWMRDEGWAGPITLQWMRDEWWAGPITLQWIRDDWWARPITMQWMSGELAQSLYSGWGMSCQKCHKYSWQPLGSCRVSLYHQNHFWIHSCNSNSPLSRAKTTSLLPPPHRNPQHLGKLLF